MAYALSSGFQDELEDVVTMDSGRLGILTELPQSALHITGETRIDGDVAINQGSLTLGGYEALVPSVSMVGAGLQAALDSRYVRASTIAASSNIADAAFSNLQVWHNTWLGGTNQGYIGNKAGTQTVCLSLAQGSNMQWAASNYPTYGIGCASTGIVGVRGYYGLRLGVGSMTNLAVASPNGYVGIQTTNPSFPLDVAGATCVRGGLTLSNSTGGVLISQNNSCLGVGTSTPQHAVDVAGNMRASGDVYGNIVAANTLAASTTIQCVPPGKVLTQDLIYSGNIQCSTYSNSQWLYGSNNTVIDSNGLIPWGRIKGVPASLCNSSDTALGAAGVTIGSLGLVMAGYSILSQKGMIMPDLNIQLSDEATPDGQTQADVKVGWDFRLSHRPLATCPYRADIGVYGDLYVNRNRRLYALDQDQFSLNEKSSREIPDGIPASKYTEIINFGSQALSLKSGLFSDALQVGPFLFKADRRGKWSLWMGGKMLIDDDGSWCNGTVRSLDTLNAPAAQGGAKSPLDKVKAFTNILFE